MNNARNTRRLSRGANAAQVQVGDLVDDGVVAPQNPALVPMGERGAGAHVSLSSPLPGVAYVRERNGGESEAAAGAAATKAKANAKEKGKGKGKRSDNAQAVRRVGDRDKQLSRHLERIHKYNASGSVLPLWRRGRDSS